MDFATVKIAVALFLLACWIAGDGHCSSPRHDDDDDDEPLPNIIVILMDDQDWVLGGMEPLAKTRRFVEQNNGAVFTNAFVSTPVCCPSRSSILTGKYVHNHGVINNSVSGNCYSSQWQNGPEKKTMATYLQAKGYRTFYGGKYLNQYGKNETGGVERVPPGYNRWVGLVGNSRYYNYTLSVDGEPRRHSDDYRNDYLTDVITKEALDFITDAGHHHHHHHNETRRRPFFALIAPPACHSPFTPAPRYAKRFSGKRAPRWPSFDRQPEPPTQKHWLMRQKSNSTSSASTLPGDVVQRIDHVFRQRWRTLLSVDDMVEQLIETLQSTGQLEATYFVLTSDHGYHMGQFGMPIDKRLPYDTDVRVPLVIVTPPPSLRAASMIKGTTNPTTRSMSIDRLAVVSVDLAPTVLHMARIQRPSDMDGVSLLPLVSVSFNAKQVKKDRTTNKTWRTSFLIEYHGEADIEDIEPGCQQDPMTTLCLEEFDCRCQDAANNTYVCLRTLEQQRGNDDAGYVIIEDSLYCSFDDDEHFVELYDLTVDPYQMNNTAAMLTMCRRHSTTSQQLYYYNNALKSNDASPLALQNDHHPYSALLYDDCFDEQHEKYLKRLADFTQCRGINCFR